MRHLKGHVLGQAVASVSWACRRAPCAPMLKPYCALLKVEVITLWQNYEFEKRGHSVILIPSTSSKTAVALVACHLHWYDMVIDWWINYNNWTNKNLSRFGCCCLRNSFLTCGHSPAFSHSSWIYYEMCWIFYQMMLFMHLCSRLLIPMFFMLLRRAVFSS